MYTRSIDPATHEPLYSCYTCNSPVVPGNPGVYWKEHRVFCSVGCLYIYYEGEPAADDHDLQS